MTTDETDLEKDDNANVFPPRPSKLHIVSGQKLTAKHLQLLGLVVVPHMFLAFHLFSPIFTLNTPRHTCRQPQDQANNNTKLSGLNSTTAFDVEVQKFTRNKLNDSVIAENCSNGCTHDLNGGKSITVEFNLICGSAWKRPFLTSTLMVGFLCGSIIGGYVSDRFGRRRVVCLSFTLLSGSVFATSFVTSYVAYAVIHFAAGFVHVIFHFVCVVLVQEQVPKTRRNQAALVIYLSVAFGFLLLPLAAYILHDWRWLTRAPAIAALCYVPVFWWLLPESEVWIRQKTNLYEKVVNDKTISSSTPFVKENDKNLSEPPVILVTTSLICLHSILRIRIVICCILWSLAYLSYYTLNLNSSNLGGNIYINCAVAALVDMASASCMGLMLAKLGRRHTCVVCYLLSGMLCLGTPVLKSVNEIAGTVCSMSGKFFTSICLTTTSVYTGEMFPTLLRSTSVGVSSMSARFGAATVPFLVFTGELVNLDIPFYALGALGVFAAGLVLFLPETSGIVLPDTVQDAVDLRSAAGCSCCTSATSTPFRKSVCEERPSKQDTEEDRLRI